MIIKCPYCDGQGQWEEATGQRDWDTGEWYTRSIWCEDCHGTGDVEIEGEPLTLCDVGPLMPIEDRTHAP